MTELQFKTGLNILRGKKNIKLLKFSYEHKVVCRTCSKQSIVPTIGLMQCKCGHYFAGATISKFVIKIADEIRTFPAFVASCPNCHAKVISRSCAGWICDCPDGHFYDLPPSCADFSLKARRSSSLKTNPFVMHAVPVPALIAIDMNKRSMKITLNPDFNIKTLQCLAAIYG